MNKCIGCGNYTEKEDLCERCFRIKNYKKYKKVSIESNKINSILKEITSNDTVVLVVDLLNIPNNFEIIKKYISNDIILVLNKYDLMPNNNEERYRTYFKKYSLNVIETFCISCKKNYNIDLLYDYICKYSDKNVYFIGYTNSGKSSLINKLIYNYSNIDTKITTSPISNTTLDTIKIQINDLVLIDTPGIIGDTLPYLDNFLLRKISKSNKIKPITYQIKGRQYIVIENIIEIEVENNDITIYVPNNISVKRYYKNHGLFSDSHIINYIVEPKSDIVISEIGFIKINKSGNINIKLKNKMSCFVRNSLI